MRPIDAPEKVLLSSRDAAAWIGVGKDLFEQLADAEDWLRPVWCGTGQRKVKKWHWFDVVCLAHVLHGREAKRSRRVPDEAT